MPPPKHPHPTCPSAALGTRRAPHRLPKPPASPRSCWECGSPLPFPGANSPVIKVTVAFTPGNETPIGNAPSASNAGAAPAALGLERGPNVCRDSLPALRTLYFVFLLLFFPQEAFNTPIQQPALQHWLRLCRIYEGK